MKISHIGLVSTVLCMSSVYAEGNSTINVHDNSIKFMPPYLIARLEFYNCLTDACQSLVALQDVFGGEGYNFPTGIETVHALRDTASKLRETCLKHENVVNVSSFLKSYRIDEDKAIQKLLTDASDELSTLAAHYENMIIHGYEAIRIFSLNDFINNIKKQMQAIVSLEGEFALVFDEILKTIINPVLHIVDLYQ